jgi:hypothetical protein
VADRLRQARVASGSKRRRGCRRSARSRPPDLRELLSVGHAADEQLEPAAEASSLRRAHAPPPSPRGARRARSRPASRPPHRQTPVVGDRRQPVRRRLGQAHRRGNRRRKTRSPKWRRTSPSPRRRVASRRPPSSEARRRFAARVEPCAHEVDRLRRAARALERVVLRLHGTSTWSAAASAFTVSGPSDGGQSRNTNSYWSRAPGQRLREVRLPCVALRPARPRPGKHRGGTGTRWRFG